MATKFNGVRESLEAEVCRPGYILLYCPKMTVQLNVAKALKLSYWLTEWADEQKDIKQAKAALKEPTVPWKKAKRML